jgi:SAM-dependent methyltransferase
MLTVDFGRTGFEPGGRVLDIGCGSGRHTAAACGLARARVVGIDPCLADLRAARERLELHARLGAQAGGTWSLLAADGLRLPFRDECFDLVVCSEVLEHIADDRRALAEIVRVLKPGARLVVSVPRFWPERLCWALSPAYAAEPGGHLRIYRRRDLDARLRAAGLRAVGAHHAHGLHTPYWWLKCLVGHRRADVRLVNGYARFLTWEMMKKPRSTRILERLLLNPLIGKSLVVYLRKGPEAAARGAPAGSPGRGAAPGARSPLRRSG